MLRDPKLGRRTALKRAAAVGTVVVGLGAGRSAASTAAAPDPDYTINKADEHTWRHGDGNGPCTAADNGVAYNLGFVAIDSQPGGTGCSGTDQFEHRMVLYGIGSGARDSDQFGPGAAAYIRDHTCEAQASSADTECGEDTVDTAQSFGFGLPAYRVDELIEEYHYGENKPTPDTYAEAKDRLDTAADVYDQIERSEFDHWDSVTAFGALGIGTVGLVSSSVTWPILGVGYSAATFLDTLQDEADQYVARDLDGGDGFRTYMETESQVGGWGLAGHYHDFEVTVPAGESLDLDVWHQIGFHEEDACGNPVDGMIDSSYSYTVHVPANEAGDDDPDTPWVEFSR
ncbi:hypothetical protein [Halovivax limisalsi]|uniref:hypothetical protein n=1 Tax=Halovivax limisalsi TaxID=1453760 RepID=UPI001FFCF64F|nr:hypothetical protein [Halovivax limisalsi]